MVEAEVLTFQAPAILLICRDFKYFLAENAGVIGENLCLARNPVVP